MIVQQQYYSTKDLMKMFGWDIRYAEQIMHMFDYRNQMYRIGRRMYVSKMALDMWMESNLSHGDVNRQVLATDKEGGEKNGKKRKKRD